MQLTKINHILYHILHQQGYSFTSWRKYSTRGDFTNILSWLLQRPLFFHFREVSARAWTTAKVALLIWTSLSPFIISLECLSFYIIRTWAEMIKSVVFIVQWVTSCHSSKTDYNTLFHTSKLRSASLFHRHFSYACITLVPTPKFVISLIFQRKKCHGSRRIERNGWPNNVRCIPHDAQNRILFISLWP